MMAVAIVSFAFNIIALSNGFIIFSNELLLTGAYISVVFELASHLVALLW